MKLQSIFPSTNGNCSENSKALKQVVERGDEATTSPEGLNYPKVKHPLEWRWTRRSATVPQRRIYRSRILGRKCETTDSTSYLLENPSSSGLSPRVPAPDVN
ncbi:hypothetical protein BHE74_00001242, partial [Ensete ventricosum]